MEEFVRKFLDAASADPFPAGARFGSTEAAEHLRRRRDRPRRPPDKVAPVGHVEDMRTGGGVPVRVYLPGGDAEPRGLVVYFHGGGWVTGDLDMHDPTCRLIASRSGSVVVNVDYRLAPEHPYPAPLDDCYEATEWSMRMAPQWGADPTRTVLGGTSAGGNLAAAVAVRRRDAAAPALAGLLLLYPVLDARMRTQSFADNAEGYLLTAPEMAYFWDAYVQDDRDRTHPWLSPGLVEDLTGLPPALVVTAEYDPLRDEGDMFALRLEKASLLWRHLRVPGQIHGFLTAFPGSPAAAEAADVIVEAVTAMTAVTGRGR